MSKNANKNKAPLPLPQVVFGTSGLGNLYEDIPYASKLQVVEQCMKGEPREITVFDSAGKYGAGLSLHVLGKCLQDLNVDSSRVLISNKLGWFQTPLLTQEPTFEPGVWKGIKNDAEQRISYKGIKECYRQGNELLYPYRAALLSVHDPDEYLSTADSAEEAQLRYTEILEAYRALLELREAGEIIGVGVGCKDWKVVQRIAADVDLDWVMIANSLTIHSHPQELMDFIEELQKRGVCVVNSAVFNGGFLTGGDHYNYRLVDRSTKAGQDLYDWRDQFWSICDKHGVKPAEACFNFSFNVPGVASIALNTTKPEKVMPNINMTSKIIPSAFWEEMHALGLLERVFG
ncbi:aldo/keto reductase [Sphingobacterium bambusae]|uniref:Aldo/keto reductase n=1 Tax=Sphingobacterium bambusae TaxID=662858 RepID=A0ABW6BJ96_9SPHI|nr:aldo/keto reductase [Sphingobacterium bambusae]WPL49473.1 aldo/keto reductase [Sphingobacterium bambusae]